MTRAQASYAERPSVIYVSPTGNDATGNGTVDQPYATFAKVNTTANTGKMIVIGAGVHETSKRLESASDG